MAKLLRIRTIVVIGFAFSTYIWHCRLITHDGGCASNNVKTRGYGRKHKLGMATVKVSIKFNLVPGPWDFICVLIR